jgi:thioredoxin reductase (NADPH)
MQARSDRDPARDPTPDPVQVPVEVSANPLAPIVTDALVIGAGPVGLFQVFELGLLDIACHVVDSLPIVGGQCIELYPDKPIYDIPGTPRCTGRELIARLLQQIAPFAPPFHLDQEVSVVEPADEGRFLVATSAGIRFLARTIFIAGGVGSFQPRRLKLVGLAAHHGRQVWHRVEAAAALAGEQVLILGDDEVAVGWAVRLAEAVDARPARITLLHRREQLRAEPGTVNRMQALCAAGAMRFVAGQAMGIEEHDARLTAVLVAHADGTEERIPVDRVLVLLGLSPRLGPIAEWGLALARKQLVVDSATFETSTPGIFAVGDINTYPGKKKLILSGFHEAALAAYGAAPRVFPERAHPLEYTTTSQRLRRLLGADAD